MAGGDLSAKVHHGEPARIGAWRVASCSCGWRGPARATASRAAIDFAGHEAAVKTYHHRGGAPSARRS